KREMFESNLGIDRRLRCRFRSQNYWALFGAPHLWVGERSTLKLCHALSNSSDCFVDIGAHAGIFVFFVGVKAPQKPIYFFEPDPDLFSDLQSNVLRNGLKNVSGFQLAVSDLSKPITFFRNLSHPDSGTIVPEDWGRDHLAPIPCEAISLAD